MANSEGQKPPVGWVEVKRKKRGDFLYQSFRRKSEPKKQEVKEVKHE